MRKLSIVFKDFITLRAIKWNTFFHNRPLSVTCEEQHHSQIVLQMYLIGLVWVTLSFLKARQEKPWLLLR